MPVSSPGPCTRTPPDWRTTRLRLSRQQEGQLGLLTRKLYALQARTSEATCTFEEVALRNEIARLQAKIERLADVMLEPGRRSKVSREFPWLSRRQYARRLQREVPIGPDADRLTRYPAGSGLHILAAVG